MNKHLSSVRVAVFAAAMLFPSPAFADHRPGNVVVMGGTLPLTGRYAGSGGRIHIGRKLYVKELNARGGLLGHKVELRILDDKSDKRTAIELYGKLITEDRVDIVLGPYSSHLTDPVANVTERYKRPIIAHAGSPGIYQRGRKYIFSGPTPPARDRHKGALHLAEQIGVKRIAIITRTELIARASSLGAQEWAKKLGLNVVLVERYPQDQMDFTPLLQRIEASGAEAIFSSSRLRDSMAQIRQMRELNINVKMFAGTTGTASPKFVKELGILAEYLVGYNSWEPKLVLGYRGLKEFIENFKKRFGVKPSRQVAGAYAVMQIYEAAVRQAGSFDPEKIREAMASIKVHTVKGVWKANEEGFAAANPLTIQIQNGERVIVWPAHMSEARFLPMPKWEDRAKK